MLAQERRARLLPARAVQRLELRHAHPETTKPARCWLLNAHFQGEHLHLSLAAVATGASARLWLQAFGGDSGCEALSKACGPWAWILCGVAAAAQAAEIGRAHV